MYNTIFDILAAVVNICENTLKIGLFSMIFDLYLYMLENTLKRLFLAYFEGIFGIQLIRGGDRPKNGIFRPLGIQTVIQFFYNLIRFEDGEHR